MEHFIVDMPNHGTTMHLFREGTRKCPARRALAKELLKKMEGKPFNIREGDFSITPATAKLGDVFLEAWEAKHAA